MVVSETFKIHIYKFYHDNNMKDVVSDNAHIRKIQSGKGVAYQIISSFPNTISVMQ